MPATPHPGALAAVPFRIGFDPNRTDAGVLVAVSTPWLAGVPTEDIFAPAIPLGEEHGVHLYRSGELLLGHVREKFVAAELSRHTESLYRRIFAAVRGQHLYRIWNYVPDINGDTAGLEHYRGFCQGRSHAFEASIGTAFEPQLPAASAVGCDGRDIDVVFAAGPNVPRHFENPTQVPAYRYPPEHGPRAPAFARASVVAHGAHTLTFISGTSAIKGHRTIAPGQLREQIDCTVDNLRLVAEAAALGRDLGQAKASARHFKIYLRHAADLAAAQAQLDGTLLRPADRVTYLRSDICRAALNVEIEATIIT